MSGEAPKLKWDTKYKAGRPEFLDKIKEALDIYTKTELGNVMGQIMKLQQMGVINNDNEDLKKLKKNFNIEDK